MKSPLFACVFALLPLSAVRADPFLVVPGHSLGLTTLGLNGDRALTVPPTASDASMGGKRDRVWRAGNGSDTLYVHTQRNDIFDPPRPGVTVTEIRVTSPRFHTRSGAAPGSTFALVRRRFPQGRLTADGHFYVAARQGIAFEFPHVPRPGTRCLAVTVFPPGPARDFRNARLATAAVIRDTLQAGG